MASEYGELSEASPRLRRPWFAAMPSPWRNPARVILLAGLVAAAADIVSVLVPDDRGRFGSGPALHLAALGLIAAALVCRAITGRPFSAWALLAAGATTTAVAGWLALGDGPDARVAMEASTLVARVLIGAGVLLLVRRRRKRDDRDLRVDGTIIGLSAGSLGAAVWFDSTFEQLREPLAALAALAVPLVDLIVAAAVIDALLSRRTRATPVAYLLAAGLAVMTSADVWHLRAVLRSTPTPAWASAAWLLGLVLVALAAAAPDARTAPAAPMDDVVRTPGAGVSAVPIMFSAVSLGVLAYGIQHAVALIASMLALASVGTAMMLRTALTVRALRGADESFVLARTDELTGLANRRGFIEALDRALSTSATSEPLAVTIIDLDGFKEVNDSFGHHAGDRLLQLVALRLRDVLPPNGVLARLGGDEFVIVTPMADIASGLAVAESARRSFDAAFEVDGATVRVGAAIGVALHPAHADTCATLLRCADIAMYDAKRSRVGVAMYTPLSDLDSRDKLQLLEDLRQTTHERHLTLHYLPTVDLHTGRVVASEALVNWRHPTRGLLAPHVFVPIAERAGLIPGITRAVLAEAIAFHAERFPDVAVSVNISHCDLVDDSLGTYIDDLLEIYRFPAAQLTLEITERALSHEPMRAAGALTAIRSRGVRVSIDDFGLGHSPNDRLFEVAVDEVKIDRSLVLAVEHDGRTLAFLRSTIQLAAALGISTVAAGIENDTVLSTLADAGVQRGQGVAISRPLTADDYAEYLARAEPPVKRRPS